MKTGTIGQRVLQSVFYMYLRVIERTVKIEWREEELCGSSQVFGFWHEDSFFMNLVLKRLAGKTAPVDVVVTADSRGEYIEYMISRCGGNALRIPDGYASFTALKCLMQSSYEQARSLAVALDGPLGPRHEPKKLAFYLAEQKQEDFVGISLCYSACLRLIWRWDRYVIPLPFSTVRVDVRNYGIVSKREIPHLPVRADMSSDEAAAPVLMGCRKYLRETLRYQKML